MPSRIVSILIVVSWLACMGWLFLREVLPQLGSGEPPAFAIDRMDDTRRDPQPIQWAAAQTIGGQKRNYKVTTRVDWDHKSDTFTFRVLFEPRRKQPEANAVTLQQLTSSYRIDPDGLMVAFESEATYDRDGASQQGSFDGIVQGADCAINWHVLAAGREISKGISEVEVSRVGAVFLPLHPMPRVRGLTPGRRWGLRMVNPLEQSIAPGNRPRIEWVTATVRSAPESLNWHRRQLPCLVIDYEGEGVQGSVWVDAEDARVLQIVFRFRLTEDDVRFRPGDDKRVDQWDDWTIVRGNNQEVLGFNWR